MDLGEFLCEFVAEAADHLATAESHLLVLRDHPEATEALQACFRSLHSVKGGAGFLDQSRIQTLAHAAEQVLDALRSGAAEVTRDRIDAVLDATTRLQALVQALAGAPAVRDGDEALSAALAGCLSIKDDYAPAISASAGLGSGEPTTRRELHRGLSSDPGLLLIRLAALRSDDIPELIQILATLRMALAGQTPAVLGVLSRLDAFCDALVLEKAGTDPGPILTGLVRDLSAAVSAAPRQRQHTVTVAVTSGIATKEVVAEILDLLVLSECSVVEASPGAGEAALRAVHSIKGLASTAGLDRLARLAQAVESTLAPLSDRAPLGPSVRTMVLTSLDGLGDLARAVIYAGAELGPWPAHAAALANRLGVEVDLAPELVPNPRLVGELVEAGVPVAEVAAAARSLQPGEDLTSRLVKTGRITPAQASQVQAQSMAPAPRQDAFARISTARLEELVDLIGELLITQAGVMQHASTAPPELRNAIIRQGRTVRELQVIALGMRLVPIKATFQKMARAVLDTARKLGKEIEFSTTGDDTELDRNLAETLSDPLLHMVRNSADHGIEDPATRRAAGKPDKGRVSLSARRAGEHILVELRDDGNGMDPARLIAKAKEKGLIPGDAQPTREEAFRLVFLPGLSTAATVSEVSGRGVGMDVVKRNVDSLRGRIEIASELGKGTTFTLHLPLTTAVLDAMVLRLADQRFLVPVAMVVEAVKPAPGQVQALAGHRGRVVQSRGRWLPVITLAERCGVIGARSLAEDCVLVVLEHLGGRLAIQVDEIIGLQQAVIKPLPPECAHDSCVAGTPILGDGHVGLILEPANLAEAS